MLRAPRADETEQLLALAVETGLFTPEDAEALLGSVLAGYLAGGLGEGHECRVYADPDSGQPVGWTYYAPDQYAANVWNLWWIGVQPSRHGTGAGRALLHHAELQATAAGARLLIIETSSLPPMGRARRFYEREGYMECGRIPDFYGEGDNKVIFAKRLQPDRPPAGPM